MCTNRMAIFIATLMFVASIGAVVARPGTKEVSSRPAISLETMIPKQFGDWREETQRIIQVINPQAQKVLDETYSQILTRSYVGTYGYRIMLSLAYGSDQRGPLRAHEPEACYPAQGFALHRKEASLLTTPYGNIPVRRLLASRGSRVEPLTYWVRIGDKTVRESRWQWKLTELNYTLTGRIPDGLIFRVSSIDPDQARANEMQDQFINQLLHAVSPAERKQLSGLGDS